MKQPKTKGPARQPPAAAWQDHTEDTRIPIEQKIGAVIRRQRLANRLTLSDLAIGAEISSAMLSRIETGQATASLEALERICHALGMSMSKLFQDAETVSGFAQLIKEAEQMEVVRSGTKHGHTYKLLSYERGPKKLFEPFLIEMDKDSVYPRFCHPGVEFIYMLSGRMEYRYGDTSYLLEPGDSFTFSGEVEHGPETIFDEKIRFLAMIMYEH
ncbi:MAG: XRE family transcriptional regulator [Acidocella sp.]|nr:XRE family transcriptional regulator [Acidocella sp.]